MEIVVAFLTGGSMSAIVSGLVSYFIYKRKRKDAEADKQDVTRKALRYIMLYIIQDRAEMYIKRGNITVDERRALHKWHNLYHNGLNGNGDAASLMETVEELPIV